MTGWASTVQRAYPPWFRDRYGPELSALVDDLPASAGTTVDLLGGAARAWLRPALATTAAPRLRATVTTTWVAWCAGFLVAPAINKALLDPPTTGASGSVRTLLDVATALFVVGWALALLDAAPVVCRVVVPALRARQWASFRPLLPVVLLALLEVLGLLWLALTSSTRVGHPGHLSAWATVGIAVWLVGAALFVASLGVGPAVAISRLAPGEGVLRLPTVLATAVAATLAALTGCSLAATIVAGDAALVSSSVPVGIALAVGCLASLTATVSAGRGLHALRRGSQPC